jgi:serine/threonine protein kinase
MGEVYAAFDSKRRRRVALKTVRAVASDERHAIHCLRREARLARRIVHPNVCRVYGFGVDDRGVDDAIHYVTMAVIDGTSLSTRLRRGPLASPEALSIARQLLQALRATHAAGVLHRDVKSSNIMVVGESADTFAILTDFGLARCMDERRTVTHAGTAGSLGYSAPEQVTGGVQDARTDLFSLGVVLYEMLTGRLPTGVLSLNALIDSPRWPATAPIEPSAGLLRRVATRCLALDPVRRYASAEEALSELDER